MTGQAARPRAQPDPDQSSHRFGPTEPVAAPWRFPPAVGTWPREPALQSAMKNPVNEQPSGP